MDYSYMDRQVKRERTPVDRMERLESDLQQRAHPWMAQAA
jgi:hypothetical protein